MKEHSFTDCSFAQIFFNADFRPNFTSFAMALRFLTDALIVQKYFN